MTYTEVYCHSEQETTLSVPLWFITYSYIILCRAWLVVLILYWICIKLTVMLLHRNHIDMWKTWYTATCQHHTAVQLRKWMLIFCSTFTRSITWWNTLKWVNAVWNFYFSIKCSMIISKLAVTELIYLCYHFYIKNIVLYCISVQLRQKKITKNF